jgi:hypothetical protein
MKRTLAWTWLALAAGCTHQEASGMVVTVQKQTASDCFATIGAASDPDLPLEPCAPPEQLGVVAGVDRLRFAIDYGDNVTVSPGIQLAAPSVTVTFDGNPAAAVARFAPMQRAGDRIYFTALYDVPAIQADHMQIAVEASPDLRVDTPALPVVVPRPVIAVQDCPGTGACSLVGVSTSVVVQIDVPSHTGQMVALGSRLDGVSRGDGRTVTTAPKQGVITTVVTAMEVPLVDRPLGWDIEAVWLGQTATAHVALTVPTIQLAIEECAAGCAPTAGVGAVHAVVEIPGDAAQHGTLRSFVGSELAGELPVATAALPGRRTQVTVPLDIPLAPDGALWRLELVWNGLTAVTSGVALRAPAVTSAIGCGTPCTVKAGTSVELLITAPRDIRAGSALFATSTDAASPTTGTITESTVNQVTASKEWRQTLAVPPTGAVWKVQASVAGYPATTILATIAP